MTEPILQLDDLSKAYGALQVTNHVSLDVRPGEIHAVIGPNGAGKTTLIGQISGSLSPDSGRIRFDGVDITALPMHARARAGLARSFQITEILPAFTTRENVALALQARDGHSFRFFRNVSRDSGLNARADACLAELGLEARAAVPAGTLSHGEKRALELAIAMACQPKLLLLDEPMAGTGREETDRLVEVLRALKGRYAMLLVEHDMSAVFALADRISVLVYGEIVATGAPEEIRDDPRVREAYLGEEAVI
ncbi:ABC transporter ATP-binding protein [Stappia sp. ES.058]|uniref:ABC transporter ATP-binding protein n=1 Tax=Stappia sp. ES.058 TaxID=1881061 RepID=UPI00087CA2EC|nr:ABC transporter ATP-binding protein [Stappia sp. ES.058]SDT99785.1 amino acid/amide ABC transporter ATP-binding protein 1, HAAT family [Stappia sp. ES.058]